MSTVVKKQIFFMGWVDISLVFAVIFSGVFAVWQGNYTRHLSFLGKSSGDITQKEEAVDIRIGQLKEQFTQESVLTKTIPPEKNYFPQFLAAVLPVKCNIIFTFLPTTSEIPTGSEVTYNINLKNTGDVSCQNTSFSLYYGNNTKFVSATPKPFAGNYYWMVGNIVPGGEYDVSLKLKHDSLDASPIYNDGCATANNGEDACGENTVFVNWQDSASIPAPTRLEAAPSSAPMPPSIPEPIISDNQALISASPGKELGTWIWESPVQMNETRSANLLELASKNGINAVYITIDDYLEIGILPDGAEKENLKKNYFEALSHIVIKAKTLGIDVDIEGGAKDWAVKENRWKGYMLIGFAKEYNERYPNAKIRNFQYDVEPYLLNSYEKNKASVLKTFLEFIDESTTRMKDVNAGFSVVIPHFYDSAQKWTPAVTYNGETKHTFSHLLSILERKQGSTVIIMSYRNFFYGDNGTRKISEAEIKETSNGSFGTHIIVAQETGNVAPSYVTFYGHSRQELFDVIETINSELSTYRSFNGVAIHYIDSFLALE